MGGVAAALPGCSGAAVVGTDVKRTAAERPDVDRAMANAGALALPAKAPFNITSVNSAQSGAARGTAELVGQDGAKCSAEARDGGSAWGEFQLGYCFDNVTEQVLQAVVKVRLKVNGSTTSTGGEQGTARAGGTPATGTSSLAFFIKDTNGVMVKKEQLYTGDLAAGAGAKGTVQDLTFDVRLEPQRGYYLVIAGRVEAQSAASQGVASSLDVTGCAMEINWQGTKPAGAPGPATPSTGVPPTPPVAPGPTS